MDPGLKLTRLILPTPEEKHLSTTLPYRSLVGFLMWIALGSRPDIQYAVSYLSQFLDCFGQTHYDAAKRIVRYLKGTRLLKLHLGGGAVDLVGFTDASYANCLDTRCSMSRYCFSLGSGLISWSSRKQKTVSTSTCETKYVAASDSCKETIWLRTLLNAIDIPQTIPSPLKCDNNAAITLSSDPSFHNRVKHIDIKYHYIRECVDAKALDVVYVNTKDNIADAFTKPLDPKPFSRMRSLMGLR